jgi:hypothetical protein
MRGIQYAVASRFHFAFSGILDRPPSRAMTIEFADGSIIIWGFRLFKQHGNLMTDLIRHTPAFSRHEAPERCIMVSPLAKQRAQGKPGARRTRSLACEMNKAHEYRHHRFAEITRPSLRNGFNGFLRDLPGDRTGDRAFLSPSSAECNSANLTPASRRQDHTTSPSASARFVKRAAASTASRARRP